MTTYRLTRGVTNIDISEDGTSDVAGGYEMQAWDPGPLPIVNVLAESAAIDGANVSSSRRGVGTVQLTVRCKGTSSSDALAKAVALAKAIECSTLAANSWDGDPNLSIRETFTPGLYCTHFLFRAAADIIRDPGMLAEGYVVVQASLECHAREWVFP